MIFRIETCGFLKVEIFFFSINLLSKEFVLNLILITIFLVWKILRKCFGKSCMDRANGETVNKEYYLGLMRHLRESVRLKRSDLWQENS